MFLPVSVCLCFGHVSVWLLSTAPAASCRLISHSRRSQDDCACFHCMQTRLLQLTAARYYRLRYSGGCSPHRTLLPAWSRVHGDGITSLRFWGTSIGCRFGVVSTMLALLVYKSLHGLLPSYLAVANDCILASSDKFLRRLRSVDVDTCIVSRTRTRFGDRSFPAAGPRIWNSLPPELRRPDTELGEFRRLLETFLFA